MADQAGSLADRTSLVTGAAARLGRAIALALARNGSNVVVHYNRSGQAANETAEQVRAEGVKCWTVQADLADSSAAASLFTRALELAGPIEVLVNSASVFPTGRVLDTTSEDIARSVQIHAAAPLLLGQAMAAQQRPGHIVNILDSRITDYDREHAAYHLGKRMLFTLTRMLAIELSPDIAVNAVAPGLILPPPGENEEHLTRMSGTNPMNRHGDPKDVADAVLYLLKSSFVSGQVIFVDGGRHLRGSVYG